MRRSWTLLSVGLIMLVLSSVHADEKTSDYLKDGKLKERLEVLQLQGGFAGFTGTYYTIEPDGSWSTGSIVPPREAKGKPRAEGKLTRKQRGELAKELARQDLAHLPSHGRPVVNPRVIKIRFGNSTSQLQPGPGKSTAEEDKAIRARYDRIVQTVEDLCKQKE